MLSPCTILHNPLHSSHKLTYNTCSRILGSVHQRAVQQYGADIKLAVSIPPNATPAERGSIVDAAKIAGAGEVDLVDSIHALVEVYTYVELCVWLVLVM